jgi:rRNA-processing protein FCF1
MSKVIAFIDTNIFLHYQPFDQIRWAKELKCDHVTLILSQIVVHELDKKKDEHPSDRIRGRARSILTRLYDKIENGGRIDDQVELRFEESPPNIDYADLRLDRSRNDDQLIASIYAYRARYGEERVLVVTNDTGLKLKSRVHSIEVVGLRDELYIKGEADTQQKRIKQLEAENAALRQTFPALKLSFRTGGDRIAFTVSPEIRVSTEAAEAWVASQVTPLVQQPTPVPASMIAKLNGKVPSPDLSGLSKLFAALAVGWNEQQKESIEKFRRECVRYYIDWIRYQNALRRTCHLGLWVENAGSAVAEEVFVFFTLPASVDVLPDGRIPAEPKFPEPAGVKLAIPPTTAEQAPRKRVVRRPVSAKLVSNDIVGSARELCYHLPKVQHHVPEWLPGLAIRYHSHVAADTLVIPYRVTASNAREAVCGELRVEVGPTTNKRKPRTLTS